MVVRPGFHADLTDRLPGPPLNWRIRLNHAAPAGSGIIPDCMPGLADIAVDALWRVRRHHRVATYTRPTEETGDPVMRARIDALGTWFQNFDLHGTPTKVRSVVGEPLDYPASDWMILKQHLPSLTGKSILDIGCNAGYHSIQSKLAGASRVVGVDVSQGVPDNFIAQARFAANELGADVDFREQDFMEVHDGPFDIVLSLGVLYHLDDPIAGLRKMADLTTSVLFLESRVSLRASPTLEFRRGGWDEDSTTPWVPSRSLINELLKKYGFTRLRPIYQRSRRRYKILAER